MEHETDLPAWMKYFGGTLLSVIALLILTLFGYIFSNQNAFQQDLFSLNSSAVKSDKFDAEVRSVNEKLAAVKAPLERIIAIETQLKQFHDDYNQAVKDAQPVKERFALLEPAVKQMQEDLKQIQKDIQQIKERLAAQEGLKAQKLEQN